MKYVAKRTFDFNGKPVKAGYPIDLSLCKSQKRAAQLIRYGYVVECKDTDTTHNTEQMCEDIKTPTKSKTSNRSKKAKKK